MAMVNKKVPLRVIPITDDEWANKLCLFVLPEEVPRETWEHIKKVSSYSKREYDIVLSSSDNDEIKWKLIPKKSYKVVFYRKDFTDKEIYRHVELFSKRVFDQFSDIYDKSKA